MNILEKFAIACFESFFDILALRQTTLYKSILLIIRQLYFYKSIFFKKYNYLNTNN